jgi:hypothetical protein
VRLSEWPLFPGIGNADISVVSLTTATIRDKCPVGVTYRCLETPRWESSSNGRTLDNKPKRGDLFLRGDVTVGFELIDALTSATIEHALPSVRAAIEAARRHGAGTIWQQTVDNRGRPLGDPFRLVSPE